LFIKVKKRVDYIFLGGIEIQIHNKDDECLAFERSGIPTTSKKVNQ
jgi:hypothetical protein